MVNRSNGNGRKYVKIKPFVTLCVVLAVVVSVVIIAVTTKREPTAIYQTYDATEPTPTESLPPLTADNETPTGWTLDPQPTLEQSSDNVIGGYENALHYWYTDDEIDALAQMVWGEARGCTADEIDALAQMVWGEARGCTADEQNLVVWTALNRVNDGYWGDTIMDVLTYPSAFAGYDTSFPIIDDIRVICYKALRRVGALRRSTDTRAIRDNNVISLFRR
ncbi:hypothetical protein AGMMS49975_05960 [Clostridia bacterium]|nr:hypothetical protein AGMMS49975_05960 [Clostridia bacterium]